MFYVLSFDPDKIAVSSGPEGKTVVRKKTTAKEYDNLTRAAQHLLKHNLVIVDNGLGAVSIAAAEIVEWNPETATLATLFYEGENLEGILRRTIGRRSSVDIAFVRKMFEAFKLNGFLWGDFAPRNIIWDKAGKAFRLVDFERELHLRDCPVDDHMFNRYVRRYSREEFSCFLTPSEQSVLFDGFLEESCFGFVPTNQIASKRKEALLKSIYGNKKGYTLTEVRYAEDIMVFAATPFQVNGGYFFPMDALDRIGSKRGADEYARAVRVVSGLEEYEKFLELKRLAETFQ